RKRRDRRERQHFYIRTPDRGRTVRGSGSSADGARRRRLIEGAAELLLRANDTDSLVQAGELERLQHAGRVRDHNHLTTVAAEALPGMEEDYETAAVQVGDPCEVEDECLGRMLTQLVHNVDEQGGGRQVHLPRRAHYRNPFN